MNEEWNQLTNFELTQGRTYQSAHSNKVIWRERGDQIKRISPWRLGHYFNSEFKKIPCYFAEFQYKDGYVRTFSNYDSIAPVGDQLSLFEDGQK